MVYYCSLCRILGYEIEYHYDDYSVHIDKKSYTVQPHPQYAHRNGQKKQINKIQVWQKPPAEE